MPFISRKKLDDLRMQVKGYYGDEAANATNAYFQRIAAAMRGVKLPPFINNITRQDIKHAYETIAPVKGIIDYLADNVGEMFKYLYLRRLKADGETYEYAPSSLAWVEKLIANPNDRFSAKRFGKAWAVNRLLFDDAWTYAPKSIGKNRNPREMYVVPSWRVATDSKAPSVPLAAIQIVGASKGEPIPLLEGGFESFGYNLDDTSFFGSSNIVAAAVYLSVLDKGMRRQDYALENGGPAGIVTPKGDNMGVLPQDADTLEEALNGSDVANKIKPLRVPIEYTALGSNPIDLNILASHKEAVTVLCFLYHLPVDLYYGQAKYENQKEAKKAIYEMNAIPLAEEFGADLLAYLGLDKDGWELVVDKDRVTVLQEGPTDALDRIEKMHGSINELRTANGFDRINEAYADEPILPLGVQFGNETYDIDENA